MFSYIYVPFLSFCDGYGVGYFYISLLHTAVEKMRIYLFLAVTKLLIKIFELYKKYDNHCQNLVNGM
ncbi:hypothetical protein HanRHA438_Chr14g0646951 [Helianthus annuus]|uniref:Uncharacterized protein n=1 Tax=Helianthus annuus TaxID=4232 RepID=A0A251SH12_HELAN|nr:hypothetical protein HanXRQr2_Chr14g0636381 [Helianthus annuus]KAJ0485183.1 hypothetical protein HanHA89_Chr14g0565361 [Helianthus annuus]KAJ0655733.1 hypothetical protein HanLR1_Chr14g0527701 [Helianthus annuus]KAJ0659417.1 hypothetical protein HanOQP8_Chr14g0525881 [Helianthus annuus]KAJ0839732.1 hypothetical protein HanPSC8_Chr14g0610331 [Helianthus annuus]